MAGPWLYHGLNSAGPWLDHGWTMAPPLLDYGRTMAGTMAGPWLDHGLTLAGPWRDHGWTIVTLVRGDTLLFPDPCSCQVVRGQEPQTALHMEQRYEQEHELETEDKRTADGRQFHCLGLSRALQAATQC